MTLPPRQRAAGGNGVINMELLSVIWRMSLRLKLPIRAIARRTGLSRNAVKKHPKADTVEPKFAISGRESKLDPFADKLSGWLKSEAGKSRQATAKRLLGGTGGTGLHRDLQPGCGLCPRLAGGSAARATNDRARHVRSPGLSSGRGVSV